MKPILLFFLLLVAQFPSNSFGFAELQDSLIYADLNCDGIYNGNDAPVPYCPILTDDGTFLGMSNATGHYAIHLDGGFNGSITPEALFGFNASDSIYAPVNDTIITSDLGMCPQSFVNNLHLEVSEICEAVQGENFGYRVCVTNYGTQPDDVTLKFLPDLGDSVAIVDLDGAQPLANFYLWQITDLLPMQRLCFELILRADDASALEEFSFIMSTYYTDNGIQDNAPSDNSVIVDGMIMSSTEINAKTVDRTEIDFLEVEIFESLQLQYQISFGIHDADTLQDLIITDTLSSYLDLATLELESVSHDYAFSIDGNIISWTFHDLQFYADHETYQNSGLIRYSISTIPNPLVTDTIWNTAHYFADSLYSFSSNSTVTSFYLCPDSVEILGNTLLCSSEGDLYWPAINDYDQYLWILDGTAISDNDSLLPYPMTAGLHDLAIIISNEACTVTGLLHVIAEEEPSLVLSEPDLSVCHEVTVMAESNAIPTWFLGDTYLAQGETFTASSNGLYTVFATNSCNSISTEIELIVPQGPDAVTINNDNGVLTLSETAESYAWYLDGNLLPGSDVPSWTAVESGNYQANLEFASGCSLLSDISLVTINMAEIVQEVIHVYPNPAGSDGFYLTGISHLQNAELSITNAQGVVIKKMKLTSPSVFIPSEEWSSGIYLLQIFKPEMAVSAQVVIQ
ncbi:MAG: T9SS type A sorting domain-containing protein [Flavobacteriales bacterium]|nr:T9SS type A sorting domain-containing protein [Flavobacteriales bacterium]